MINISINSYIKTKEVIIGDRKFYFKQMGAGDQLDISQIASKMKEFQGKFLNLKAKDEADKEKKQDKLISEFNKLVEDMRNVYRRLFSDDNNGEDVEWLLNTIDLEVMPSLIADIQKAE